MTEGDGKCSVFSTASEGDSLLMLLLGLAPWPVQLAGGTCFGMLGGGALHDVVAMVSDPTCRPRCTLRSTSAGHAARLALVPRFPAPRLH